MISMSTGVKKVKIDLHVHTPASYDFSYKPLSKEDAYEKLLDEALDNDLRIIAITDHNTFSGYNYLSALIKSKDEISKQYRNLCILCGIEITCFSKHLIAVFPNDFDEDKQKRFLNDIGIDTFSEGSENALADNLGPSLLIDKISENGGFAFLAHADSNKGFLQNLCKSSSAINENDLNFNGKSLAKIIKNPGLLGIQCNDDINKEKLISKLSNKDYSRKASPLAYIKCSDCHGLLLNDKYTGKSGSKLGSKYSEIKLSEVSFESLKMALIDSEMRICYNTEPTKYSFIEGVAVCSSIFNKDGKYTCFRFNSELNCIIGSRGTGKTTLLDIIQSIIMPNSLKGNSLDQAYQKYSSAVVFINENDNIYAVFGSNSSSFDNYTQERQFYSNRKIYFKGKKAKRFSTNKKLFNQEFLKLYLTAGYQQRQLFEYSKNPRKILEIVDDFINWKYHNEYQSIIKQIENITKKLSEQLLLIKTRRNNSTKNFYKYISDEGHLKEIINYLKIINNNRIKLSKLRKQMIDELNNLLIGKLKLSLTKEISDNHWEYGINDLSNRISRMKNKYYDYQITIREIITKVYKVSIYADSFDFYIFLLESSFNEIKNNYKLDENVEESDLIAIRDSLDEEDIQVFLDDSLKMEYNINSGTTYNENYKDNKRISMGQNAVALLLLILNAAYNLNDNRPLLMDQPEDDLDNSYIYSTLVKEFRNSKQKRQIIISTHNPNIPVAADAENILVLKYNGSNSYLSNNGAIDSRVTANNVLEIMEGGKEAIKRRVSKYDTRL